MNKNKETTRAKRLKVKLAKETVLHLTSDMLKGVAGGRQPESDGSCETFCHCL